MQALSADQSCKETVARVNAERLAHGLAAASPDTSAYCQARARLPEELVASVAKGLGGRLEAHASNRQLLWKNRHVKIIDGTTITMADSPASRAAFPQNSTQKPGCGFPIARLVVILSLATGGLLDMAVGPFEGKGTGEHALLRTIFGSLANDDVILGDAYFASYFLVAMLIELGVDAVFHAHGARKVDMRRGKRLGQHDHVVTWKKPQRPAWMSREEFDLVRGELACANAASSSSVPAFAQRS